MKKRVHVYYSGRVQGVGFRFTAEETARSMGVVGWIKNLRDGRVEMIAEGEEKLLTEFLDAIRTGAMRNFIKDVYISWSASMENCSDFEIRAL